MNGAQHTPSPPAGAPFDELDRGKQALVQTVRILIMCLRVLIILLLGWFLCSGMFIVREDEEAMLFRFGKLIPKNGRYVLRSGWYWGFPYPIDRVQRIKARRSVTIETRHFWPYINPAVTDPYKNPPRTLVPGRDGYVVTGDANIIHMIWSVTYRVSDIPKYYLEFYQDPDRPELKEAERRAAARGVEVLIEDLLEQCVLHEAAQWKVDEVLKTSRTIQDKAGPVREDLSSAVRRRLEKRLHDLNVGIEVQQVSVLQPQPPPAALKAFEEVVNAAQEYRRAVDNAQAEATTIEARAQARASEIIAEASQYRDRIVKSVQADAQYFKKILGEYRKSPEILLALYTDALKAVLTGSGDRYVVARRPAGTQEVRLLLGPEPRKRGASSEVSSEEAAAGTSESGAAE